VRLEDFTDATSPFVRLSLLLPRFFQSGRKFNINTTEDILRVVVKANLSALESIKFDSPRLFSKLKERVLVESPFEHRVGFLILTIRLTHFRCVHARWGVNNF